MLKVERFVFSPFLENTYIVFDDNTREAVIIDPGCYEKTEREIVSKFIFDEKLKLIYMFNTHCHIDHIFGNAFIKEKYNPKYIAPEEDIFLLDLMIEQAKSYNAEFSPSPKPDEYFSEALHVKIGEYNCSFIFTPGHSPGEYCIYFEKEKICFTGDVIFKESIGRTDLWGGDYDTLLKSIKNKLLTLPDDVTIYPGHEDSSTIKHEKKFNPFLINN